MRPWLSTMPVTVECSAASAASAGSSARASAALSQRSPEETRALMSSYQKGSDRGRQVTGDGQRPVGNGEREDR